MNTGSISLALVSTWYMDTYQPLTLLLVHNYVLSVSKDHVQFFSKNLIFFIFFLLQTRYQNSALLKIPKIGTVRYRVQREVEY